MTSIQLNRNHAAELSNFGRVNSEYHRKGTIGYTGLTTGWSNELYVKLWDLFHGMA